MTAYLVISTIALIGWIAIIGNLLYNICIAYRDNSWIRQYVNFSFHDLNRKKLIMLREKIDRRLARIEDE